MNRLKKAMAAVMTLAVIFMMVTPAITKAGNTGLTLSVPDNKVPTYKAKQENQPEFQVIVTNNGDTPVTKVEVKPELKSNGDEWPFIIDNQNYSKTIDSIAAKSSATVSFPFKVRDNIPTRSYTLNFSASADGDVSGGALFYVNTVAKQVEPEKKDENKEDAANKGGASDDAAAQFAQAGGFSNGDASFSGGSGDSSGTGTVPRVIVTGFDTDPAEVRAGSDFKLTVHLRNTAKGTKVNNLLFDLQAPTEGADEQAIAPAFLPASGASSIYLDSIAAGGTADISIQLNAKGDLLQKPYSINMSMKYEDGNAAQIEAASSISIPVKQDARFEFSDFEISPESIAVGEEANVMCSLYNLGRIKLYNVKAVFEGKGIKKEQVFVGNVESGASAAIDAMLEGEKESSGPAKITMTVSYEDEAGKASSTTKDLQLEVTKGEKDNMQTAMMEEPQKSGFPIIPVIVIAVVVAAIAAVVIIIKKKKKKIMADEEEELLNELDGPAQDEQ